MANGLIRISSTVRYILFIQFFFLVSFYFYFFPFAWLMACGVTQHLHMLLGESHVSRGPIQLLGNIIYAPCHVSLNVSIK